MIEDDRLCAARRWRYLLATKNIMAPYRAAPPTAPTAAPTAVGLTDDCEPELPKSPIPGFEDELADGLLPVPEPPPAMEGSATNGKVVSIRDTSWNTGDVSGS